MTKREKYFATALVVVAIATPSLLFGIPYVSYLTAVRHHHAHFLAAREKLAIAQEQPAPRDTPELLDMREPLDALVQLGYFEHTLIPLKAECSQDAAGTLYRNLCSNFDFEEGFFWLWLWHAERPQPGVEVWATPDQIRRLKTVVEEHERRRADAATRAGGEVDE